jgi:hypothetical protein
VVADFVTDLLRTLVLQVKDLKVERATLHLQVLVAVAELAQKV